MLGACSAMVSMTVSPNASRWLAQTLDRNSDLAFTVGLVHGVGQLVMHAAAPAAMKPLDAECHPLAFERTALEQARLGYHHGEVGAELAARWKFPAEVSDALRRAIGLPVTWLAAEGTLGFEASSGLPAMPPLAELTSGLEAMLD